MILKMNNKDENFYNYMGKIFGSRIIQRQTNDRIYDDNDKQWYVYVEDTRVTAFVSISKDVIKNIYTVKEENLVEVLKEVRKENKIVESIVTNLYEDLYKQAGFQINHTDYLKNFVMIYDN